MPSILDIRYHQGYWTILRGHWELESLCVATFRAVMYNISPTFCLACTHSTPGKDKCYHEQRASLLSQQVIKWSAYAGNDIHEHKMNSVKCFPCSSSNLTFCQHIFHPTFVGEIAGSDCFNRDVIALLNNLLENALCCKSAIVFHCYF